MSSFLFLYKSFSSYLNVLYDGRQEAVKLLFCGIMLSESFRIAWSIHF